MLAKCEPNCMVQNIQNLEILTKKRVVSNDFLQKDKRLTPSCKTDAIVAETIIVNDKLSLKCQTTVIFGIMKDRSPMINTLSIVICSTCRTSSEMDNLNCSFFVKKI